MKENPYLFPTPEELTVPEFPPMVLINLTNVCPLSCAKCPLPQMRKTSDFIPERMDMATFQKIVDEAALYPENPKTVVKLLGDGEPLAVPWIPEMVEYAKEKGIAPIGIITSGFVLTEKLSRRFLEAGMDYIDFSLDALGEETYNKVRPGSNFRKVMGNLGNFLRLRREIQGENPKTKVLVNIIDQPVVRHEVEPFLKFWGSYVDQAYVRTLHSVAGLVPLASKNKDVATNRWPCRVLWERVDVNPNGDISHCSISWERKEATIGNINENTIRESWNSEKARSLREAHVCGNIPAGSLCHDCQDWQTFKWGDSSQKFLTELTKKE